MRLYLGVIWFWPRYVLLDKLIRCLSKNLATGTEGHNRQRLNATFWSSLLKLLVHGNRLIEKLSRYLRVLHHTRSSFPSPFVYFARKHQLPCLKPKRRSVIFLSRQQAQGDTCLNLPSYEIHLFRRWNFVGQTFQGCISNCWKISLKVIWILPFRIKESPFNSKHGKFVDRLCVSKSTVF